RIEARELEEVDAEELRREEAGGLAGATARVENAAGDSAGGAAVRRALRRLDDAGGASAQDALPGGEHLRATAAPAQGAARRFRGGKAPAAVGGNDAPERARKGVGVPDALWALGRSAGQR